MRALPMVPHCIIKPQAGHGDECLICLVEQLKKTSATINNSICKSQAAAAQVQTN
jgi:hypothetical protein